MNKQIGTGADMISLRRKLRTWDDFTAKLLLATIWSSLRIELDSGLNILKGKYMKE